MRIKKVLVTLAAVIALAGMAPSAATADEYDSAIRYDRCITRVTQSLHDCLDHAMITEALCWSRYGYAKLWCTLRYGVDEIFGA